MIASPAPVSTTWLVHLVPADLAIIASNFAPKHFFEDAHG